MRKLDDMGASLYPRVVFSLIGINYLTRHRSTGPRTRNPLTGCGNTHTQGQHQERKQRHAGKNATRRLPCAGVHRMHMRWRRII